MNYGRAFGAGALGGLVMTILMTLGRMMGMMGGVHPLMAPPPAPEGYLMAPGVFASNFGPMTVMAFIVLHLIYGAIVGAMYRVTAEHLHHRPGFPTPA